MSVDDVEGFYREFWASDEWSGPEPNQDERSRLDAILPLVEGLQLPTRSRILDLGCGRGWLTRRLDRFGDVVGSDVVAAAVEQARELFPTLRFVASDMDGLLREFGPGAFDLVVSSEVLEHVPDDGKPAFLRGVHDLLGAGGHALLTTPRGELRAAWDRTVPDGQPVEDWVSEAELDELVSAAGFRVVRRRRACVYPVTFGSRVASAPGVRQLLQAVPGGPQLSDRLGIYQVVLVRRS